MSPGPGPGTSDDFSFAVGRVVGVVVVTLRGRLERAHATFLGWLLEDLIEAQGNLSVAIDLRPLNYLDPAGAEVIAKSFALARRHHASLRLSGAIPSVERTLLLAAGVASAS